MQTPQIPPQIPDLLAFYKPILPRNYMSGGGGLFHNHKSFLSGYKDTDDLHAINSSTIDFSHSNHYLLQQKAHTHPSLNQFLKLPIGLSLSMELLYILGYLS